MSPPCDAFAPRAADPSAEVLDDLRLRVAPGEWWTGASGRRGPLTDDCFGRPYTDADIELALARDPRSGLAERAFIPFTWRACLLWLPEPSRRCSGSGSVISEYPSGRRRER
ncbi:hypothetical protein GCM10022252_79450 [Streptosporangium oxazolinicum]|uniref:Uncharacterized protein n=1 Tax=Streptosporangium oxazolinicum TaxID=909287 RepID=A0ABP8BPD1_9ACTN